MMLESLYCGNIYPADQAIPLDKEYQKLRHKGLEELESKLTPEQMKLVNQFHSDVISSHCMEVETQFQYGFALGMLLMKDVYELPFPDKRMR